MLLENALAFCKTCNTLFHLSNIFKILANLEEKHLEKKKLEEINELKHSYRYYEKNLCACSNFLIYKTFKWFSSKNREESWTSQLDIRTCFILINKHRLQICKCRGRVSVISPTCSSPEIPNVIHLRDRQISFLILDRTTYWVFTHWMHLSIQTSLNELAVLVHYLLINFMQFKF